MEIVYCDEDKKNHIINLSHHLYWDEGYGLTIFNDVVILTYFPLTGSSSQDQTEFQLSYNSIKISNSCTSKFYNYSINYSSIDNTEL